MSGKVKMRCARCGKSFKSASAKQTLCGQCEARARQERATKVAAKPATAPVARAAPKIVGPGASMLVPGTHSHAGAGAPPPETDAAGAAAHAERPEYSERSAPPGRHDAHVSVASPAGREGHPERAGATRATQPRREKTAERREPHAPREPRAPQPRVQLTDDLRASIEARYLELARPVEYDGIRSRIATELSLPKTLVKRAVLEFRQRQQMPSWWELQAYTGTAEDLERIRSAYAPHLPVPAIGVHKQIAAELGLEPVQVYQGIKRIRAELRLPQYNPPRAHEQPTAADEHAGAASAGRAAASAEHSGTAGAVEVEVRAEAQTES